MKANRYSITVGNIGNVGNYPNRASAMAEFWKWTEITDSQYGRASGESVVLWENGEPIKIYNESQEEA